MCCTVTRYVSANVLVRRPGIGGKDGPTLQPEISSCVVFSSKVTVDTHVVVPRENVQLSEGLFAWAAFTSPLTATVRWAESPTPGAVLSGEKGCAHAMQIVATNERIPTAAFFIFLSGMGARKTH
jgi:hypothetical protein